MQFTTTAIAAVLSASTALAAPVTSDVPSVEAVKAIPDWTITNLKRECNDADTSCTWSFGVYLNTGAAGSVPCTFTVTGSPASQTDTTTPQICEDFTVTTGWSGQFGPGNGFTTMALYLHYENQIAWPAYTDAELAGGKTVFPNKSFPVTQM